MSGRYRRMAAWALAVAAVLCCQLAPSDADGNIGCLFSPSLCSKGVEWCYDDFAFGRCIPIYEDQPEDSSLFQYNMSTEELKSFEVVLKNLVSLGYRWEHAYTQCVLQIMLISSKMHLKTINMKECEAFTDPNLISNAEGEPNENVDPEEVAYVRFTPNSPITISDSDFANEVYAPPNPDIDPLLSSEYPPQQEISYVDRDGHAHAIEDKGSPQSDFTNKMHNIMRLRGDVPIDESPFDAFRDKIISDGVYDPTQDGLYDDYPSEEITDRTNKIKKSSFADHYESHNNGAEVYDEDEDRLLTHFRKLQGKLPHYTTEHLLANRYSPKEAEVLSNTLERYREKFQTKQFPFEYEDENNEIPEPRIYAEEEEPDGFHLESGSGAFEPNNKFPQKGDGDLTDDEKNKNMDLLLKYWREDLLRGNKPLEALYAEGGPLLMDRATGDKMNALSDDDLPGIISNYDWGFKRRERLDVKKPGPRLDSQALVFKFKKNLTESSRAHTIPVKKFKKERYNNKDFDVDPNFTYVLFEQRFTDWNEGLKIIDKIRELIGLTKNEISQPRVDVGEVTFKVENNSIKITAEEVAGKIGSIMKQLNDVLHVQVTEAGVGDKIKNPVFKIQHVDENSVMSVREIILLVLLMSSVVVVTAGATLMLLLRRDEKRKLAGLASAAEIDAEATQDYQELCRARMTGKWSGQQTVPASGAVCGGDLPQRIASLSKEPDGNSPSTRSSTSSWSEEPALTNMDISTGHMVLAYMEDHLKNKDRLEQEWQGLCAYEAEPCATVAALTEDNIKKNRYPDIVPYDHARVCLNTVTNNLGSDYINASTITDHDPRNPAYIAAQGPMEHTAADFWQMVWEQGSVVMVMLTRLTENGAQQCHRYWPEEASDLYHIYEVHLVSEHIWCDDYLVRSFYLKNQRTGETRTVTQFHFLSWPDNGVPASTKALLEFRRKVNKSYRGRSCPIVVHCSDGASRTGTYCLIDMVLNRMAKGAKEIDIAATLEHIRDQRPHMVSTKQQFEFVLMAVAEEVHAILKALPAQLQQQHEKKDKEATDKDKAN